MCKLEGYKCSLSAKSKEQCKKHKKKKNDNLLQNFEKNHSRPFSSSSFISSSFLVCFEQLKT
jgi:hypothetical protein